MIEIAENYKRITENVEKARSDYAPGSKIRIMAVTKGVPHEKVNHAVSFGIDLIGENRAQEFLQKHPFYAKKCEIHFIGGLQNNKVKYIIDKVSVIQSADSLKLISEINRRAVNSGLIMNLLIEVNIGCEYSKNGVEAGRLPVLLAQADELENVKLRGLMAIPPINAEENIYASMRRLYEDARAKVKQPDEFDTLSMGMSGDYVTAIKHGANIIRIGSALFGSR
ncbi:MAG: YggS family pyridoxal phosphate-dependent enzyme [Oscillospiraceae bacterium]|jgi:pyridoxal phosphate enzyme (YggS family)|nr:YggS family pyridoxal phosphate-dependent enzyme [Oscillospiraceae bacterium]